MLMQRWIAGVAVAATMLGAGQAQAQAAPGDPLGPQFTITTQGGSAPQVARDAAGNFLAVWQEPYISARRYYADGTPQGPQFQVTPASQPSAHAPALAMSAAGDYVVAWRAFDPVDSATLIYARSFDAGGAPRSALLQVARLTQGAGYHSVAMAPDGRFVVVWNDFVQIYGPIPGVSEGTFALGYSTVHARRYALDGSGGAGNILVTSSLTNPTPLLGTYNAYAPQAAMDAQGNFVVVWEDKTALTNNVIYAQRYKASGLPAGLKTRINPTLPLVAYQPVVAMDHAGNYLIGWHVLHRISSNYSSGYDVWARRYSAAGLGQGAAFQVNAGPGGGVSIHEALDVALDPDGDAVVAWAGSPGNSCCVPSEIDLQRYSAAGAAQGGKTSVTPSGSDEVRITAPPSVAMDSYGNVVVIWFALEGLQARLYQAY
ncbi:hypothetical protein D0B54_03335 [Solimonas sp. K1W22B-7]|uniref:hypothetical protein n=1 Tax=Solimonas sp. K1W22B-7 TaxID=2303331 RepID=UPI000E330E30|nr:hypothetical protein [Solimonas sp. K1W22B-7]AXQ27763.1 hypothetical protein D0B54_03335 [Solimonas sp. K1W22B-7]